jgi:hypothetical protein
MSEKKRNKLILGFLFLFWGIILFVFIKKIYTFWENKISFRIEESTDSLPEIIKSSLDRMGKRWHISDQCVIFQESIRLNEYGELEELSIKLMDRDYISYSINLSRDSKDKKKVFGTVYREGKAKGELTATQNIFSQGIPVEKNELLIQFLQAEYDFQFPTIVEYSHIFGKGLVKPESQIADFENIFLGSDKDDHYYFSHTSELRTQGEWENKFAILIPENSESR